jgi:hypothetical protein
MRTAIMYNLLGYSDGSVDSMRLYAPSFRVSKVRVLILLELQLIEHRPVVNCKYCT